ncbi:MAG: hypothetical protein O2968_19480 [Acidobacteria bacterium]|nr:hypothetical protein [Acidobacteriota bacterium]
MQDTPAGSRAERFLRRTPLVALIYLGLAVAMTWPLAADFAGSVPAGAGDLWQNYWNFWWWKTALLEMGQHPYYCPLIFFPTGGKLIFHTHSAFNMLVALPITATLGPAAAYNFCILLALWLSGFGMYLLLRELTAEARGAFLGGLVFAFFPQTMEQIFEHLNLITLQFIPLTMFFFIRLTRRGGVRNLAGTGICFALNALCGWHLGLKLTLVLLPLAILHLARPVRPRRVLLRDWTLAGLLALLFMLPLLAPVVVEMASVEDDYYRKPPQNLGVEAPYVFVPHYGHPLWGGAVSAAYVDRPYAAPGYVCYLGFVPLALGLWALLRRKSGSVYWSLFVLGAIVIALGRHPFWGGEVVESITLPFYLLEQLPVFDLMRVANRFMILASVGLAVLTGLGWSAIRKKADWRFAVLACAILFEYSWWPYPTRRVETSPVYEQLIGGADDGAIFNIPSNQRSRSGHNLVAQTVHGRAINGGYVSTSAPRAQAFIDSHPALADLDGIPKLEGPVDTAALNRLGFEFVVIHKSRLNSYRDRILATADRNDIVLTRTQSRLGDMPDEIYERLRNELSASCGDPRFEDDAIVVFSLNGCSTQ